MSALAEELSVEVRWATLPNHQRPLRALYERCAPAGRIEELKRLSQRVGVRVRVRVRISV